MARRLLIALGTLAACGALAVAALPFLIDANRYRGQAQSKLQETLGRPASIGSLAWRRFPLSVEAKNVAIGGKAAFLTVESLTVTPDWVALLLHRRFAAGSIVLDHPSIEVVRETDGSWNLPAPVANSGATGPVTLEIRHGIVAFTDLKAGKPRKLYGLTLRAEQLSPNGTYKVQAAIPSGLEGTPSGNALVNITPKTISAKGQLSAGGGALDFDVTLDRDTSLLHIASLASKAGANSLGATGTADLRSSPPVLHLRADRLQGPITGLVQWAALLGVAAPPGVTLAGNLDGNLSIDGPLDHPALTGHFAVTNFEASSQAWKLPVRSPLLRLDFDPSSLRAAPMTLTCGNSQLAASGTVSNYTKDEPNIDASIQSSHVSLDELLNIASAGISGRGMAAIDIHASGPAKNPHLTGSLSLDNAILTLQSFPKPLAIAHLNMRFAGASAAVDSLAVTIGGSNLTGHLTVKNFAAPQVAFAIDADRLDLAQFQTAHSPHAASPFGKLAAKGTLTAGELVSNGVTLTHLKAGLAIDHGIARLAPLTAGMFEGSVTGSIEADLRPSVPTFHTGLTMSRVDFNSLLSATTPLKQMLYGRLSAGAALSFSGTQAATLAPTLNGTLDLHLANGRLMGINLLNEVARAGRFLGFHGDDKPYTTISRMDAQLTFANGSGQADALRLEADGATITGGGALNVVDQSLDLRLVAGLSKELLDRAGGNIAGGLMVTALSGPDGSVVVPVRVRGTFAQPRVTPDAERFAEMKLRMLEHPIDTLRGIFDKLTKPKP